MGETARDPIDYHRTTQPLAGETMKNTAKTLVWCSLRWPWWLLWSAWPALPSDRSTQESARRSSHCSLQARPWRGWPWRQDGSAVPYSKAAKLHTEFRTSDLMTRATSRPSGPLSRPPFRSAAR
jgi:hypothetical protein